MIKLGHLNSNEELEFLFDYKYINKIQMKEVLDINNIYYLIIDYHMHEENVYTIIISKYFENRKNSIGCTIKNLYKEFPFAWSKWESKNVDGTIFHINKNKIKEIILDINRIARLKEFL